MKIEDVLTEEQQQDLKKLMCCADTSSCNDCKYNNNNLCDLNYVEMALSIINTLTTALVSVPTTEKRSDLVYICSPYAGDVRENVSSAQSYAGAIWDDGKIPIAPHLYFPQFAADESDVDRERALQECEKAVAMCSEIRVYGNYISDGMKREITAAIKAGVPIRWCEA
jgi:hypothetical protein